MPINVHRTQRYTTFKDVNTSPSLHQAAYVT